MIDLSNTDLQNTIIKTYNETIKSSTPQTIENVVNKLSEILDEQNPTPPEKFFIIAAIKENLGVDYKIQGVKRVLVQNYIDNNIAKNDNEAKNLIETNITTPIKNIIAGIDKTKLAQQKIQKS